MSRSGSEKGRGCRSTVFIKLKMAVVAPMPSPMVRIVVMANPGALRICLTEKPMFWDSRPIGTLLLMNSILLQSPGHLVDALDPVGSGRIPRDPCFVMFVERLQCSNLDAWGLGLRSPGAWPVSRIR